MSTDKGIGTEPLNFYQRDEDFWDKYIKGRPKLSDEFFNRIFEYHASHGGHFDVAHDLGAGPGVWSPSLAKRFKQVIVSDVSESNVHQAEARLGSHGYSFKVASVNDPPGNVPDSTVDLVFAGTMMHFAESDKAIPNIVAQLKSGGTFAVYCPGRPMIDDMSVEKTFKDALHDGARAIWRHAKDQNERLHSLWRIAHGYDSMPLPEEFFLEGAKRITLNAESMDDFIPPEMDAEGTKLFGHEHAVTPYDVLSTESDEAMRFHATYEDLKAILDSTPGPTLEPETFEPHWKKLAEILPNGKTVETVFPGRVILATRR